MREILFKAKRADNKEWVYGNLVYGCVNEYAYIVEFGNKELCRNYVPIIPETVCQYTGLQDKNGKKIFEGDIVIPRYNGFKEFAVEYNNGAYNIARYKISNCEIIGNIHDRSGNSE